MSLIIGICFGALIGSLCCIALVDYLEMETKIRIIRIHEEIAKLQQNQCDGCMKGIPLVDGLHKAEGYGVIACTRKRYQKPHEGE